MNGSVESLLARVRAALAASGKAGAAARPPSDFRPLLPPVPGGAAELAALFARNAAELKAEFAELKSESEVGERLKEMAAEGGWKRVASHRGGLAEKVCVAPGLPVFWSEAGYDKSGLEDCDASVTDCDALVAQTGGVLVTARSAGGRALSVLPPHHVVVARREQLLAGLPDAFELLARKYGGDFPSFISFITGPSRTADIEQTLVLGAHGPRKLTILLF